MIALVLTDEELCDLVTFALGKYDNPVNVELKSDDVFVSALDQHGGSRYWNVNFETRKEPDDE